jgi:hypothetical protein
MTIPQERIEMPGATADDKFNELTVGRLMEFLEKIPKDYKIKYDSFCGLILVEDFTIDHKDREISING